VHSHRRNSENSPPRHLNRFALLLRRRIKFGLAAQKIGVSTEDMSRLKFVAGEVIVSFDELTRGLGLFAKNAALSGEGNKVLTADFRELGVQVPMLTVTSGRYRSYCCRQPMASPTCRTALKRRAWRQHSLS
jgi:hypothetical protein